MDEGRKGDEVRAPRFNGVIMKTVSSNKAALSCKKGFFRAVLMMLLLFMGTAFPLLSLSVNEAFAAHYHDLEKNRQPCNDCHTLHYSEAGTQPSRTEAGGPFQMLLMRSTTNKLCLFCHDGSDPNAPDVLDAVAMYNGSGDEHSGAGFFTTAGSANPNGHDLGVNASTVPFSSRTNVTITCASCHDPHGTPNYRNILTSPSGGAGTGVIMGTDVFRNFPPSDPPSPQGSINAYRRSNEGYKANTSKWCTECHDALKPHVNSTSSTQRTQDHHLADDSMNWYGLPKTDPDHWLGGTGSGFGTITGDDTEGIPRLRFQVSGAADFNASQVVARENQVLCASCHLAHGGKYLKGLEWPNLEPGSPVDANSGCQQCHNF